jgi:hypothetical protein
MGTPAIIDAPTGSSELSYTAQFGSMYVADVQLDSLANSTESSTIEYPNPSGQTYATVDVFLNKISPTGTPKIQLISGSDGYELTVSTTANIGRQVRFVDIPATFLASFTVKNNTGVALASTGNFVVITPKY